MNNAGRFRFLDEVDAQRQLGVDRLTFEDLLRTKRLRPVSPGFFRGADVAKLRDELNPESADEDAVNAGETTPADAPTEAAPTAKPKKAYDPAMRVHLRLTADLKWYDIIESEMRAWFDQLRPDAYERQRANARFVIERMQAILALIDEGEARLAREATEDSPREN